MIPLILTFLQGIPLRVWAGAVGILALLGLYGCQRYEIRTLRAELTATKAVLEQLRVQSQAQIAQVQVAERRIADVDLRAKWLFKEFGEKLPTTEEEARVWALKAAKEIGQ